MFSKNARKMNSKKVTGQGMSEYLIIVGLIAVAGIAVMGLMGGTVRTQLGAMSQELSGTDGTTTIGDAQGLADDAADAANTRRGLGSFGGQEAIINP